MRVHVVAGLGALLLGSNAIFGVGQSGATWSHGSSTAAAVTAADDWTPPTVTVSPLPSTVQGTVTVTANANDARSPIASVVVEHRAVDASTWTALTGCVVTGTDPATASCSWDTSGLPEGEYEVRARATDTAGYSATSAPVATTVRSVQGVRLDPLATYLRGTVPVTGTVLSASGTATARLVLESSPSGSTTFEQLGRDCAAGPVTSLTCTWDTTQVGDGFYDVRARAVSSTTFLDLRAGLVVDNTAPTGAVTVPDGVLSGNVALSATAADATAGVASVTLQHAVAGSGDWTSCAPTTGTYSCSLDTTTLTNGATYAFRAVVTDAAGNVTTTASRTAVVDNSPATVAVTSPATGAVLGGVTTVTVDATSPRGISSIRVEYRLPDGTWATACTPSGTRSTCSWDTSALTGGYELRAVAVETSGGGTPASDPVAVTVDNAVGTVTVTNPGKDSTVSGTVTLHATTDSPTGVTSVALQVRTGTDGWTTICTDTTSPYACDWVTPQEYGTSWQVRAVMAQGNQQVATSATVPVTVRNIDGTVAVTSPTTGSTLKASPVLLTASAASNAGVASVTFRMKAPNGAVTECAATGTGPYSCSWDTSAVDYGSYVVTAVMVRGDGSVLTSAPVTVTVDGRVVRGVDVQGANGGVSGIPDANDTVTFTYSSLMNLSTISTGLAYGSSVPINVSLTGSTGHLGDTLSFPGSALGPVTVASNFFSNNKTLAFHGSTLTASQGTDAEGFPVTVLTMRLGTAATIPLGERLLPVTTPGHLTWSPNGAATDVNGVAITTAGVSERGASDLDF